MLVLVDPAHERFRVSTNTPARYLLDRWLIGVTNRVEEIGGTVLVCEHVRYRNASPALMFGLVCRDPEFTVDYLECASCLAWRWKATADCKKGWDIEPSCALCGTETNALLPAFHVVGPVAVYGLLCAGCHSESCGVPDAA